MPFEYQKINHCGCLHIPYNEMTETVLSQKQCDQCSSTEKPRNPGACRLSMEVTAKDRLLCVLQSNRNRLWNKKMLLKSCSLRSNIKCIS